jgi:hypothetical protein
MLVLAVEGERRGSKSCVASEVSRLWSRPVRSRESCGLLVTHMHRAISWIIADLQSAGCRMRDKEDRTWQEDVGITPTS